MTARPERGTVQTSAVCDNCGETVLRTRLANSQDNFWYHAYTGLAKCTDEPAIHPIPWGGPGR
jgi:hypothetical protein